MNQENDVKRTSFRAIVPGVAVLALALSACGAGNDEGDDNGDGGSGGETAATTYSGEINGGGATSQEKAQAAWRSGFQTANAEATINYDAIGSGDGRKGFIDGAYSFAGTDSALDDSEGELTAAGERCSGGNVIQVPAYVSPIAVLFNLDGVDTLNLAPDTLANIFNGTITSWDDDAIAATNEGVELPAQDIKIVHRSDDSGTTENFTAYLAAAGGGAWTEEPDGLWPEGLPGEGADGTSGLVGALGDIDGGIGYADASAAGDLGVASVQVGEEFNAPSAEGAAQVVASSPPVEGVGETDMAVELARDTTESGAYPVLLVSYLVACETYDSAEEADLVKGYLDYVISPEGQEAAAAEAGSAPLDSALSDKALGLIEAISAS
jgi:phosphate transport system substrate-binding protein